MSSGSPIRPPASRRGSLVGYILYGLILGVAYATIDRLWVKPFIESDPLNREREGADVNILLSLG
jgi:hypothetical protein